MSEPVALALDIGGTKLAAGVISRSGTLLCAARISTPRIRDADVLFAALVELARRVVRSSGVPVDLVGAGCGGPMRYPDGVVSPLNIPAWREFPLRARLRAAFDRPCVVDNDANAYALAEYWRGGARQSRHLLGMVVSTGVGGGIVRAGQIEHGASGNAGHIGHLIVWPDGPPCSCGARGCLEAVASGTGLARRLGAALGGGVPSALPFDASAAAIAAAARRGDGLALDLVQAAGTALGRAIASAAALLDLDQVLLGGSIARHAWDLLQPPLVTALHEAAQLEFTRHLPIDRSALGDEGGLLGAAALAFLTEHAAA